jgi:hypothetical protein
LLLQVSRCILGIGSAKAGADDGTRCRAYAGAAPTSDCSAERCPETSAKKSATYSLGIGLVAQWGGLRVRILPACLIIIIRLCHRAGGHGECRQDRADKPCRDYLHRMILLPG